MRGKFMVKIRNFEFWGLYCHMSAPDKREIWHFGPLPRSKFHVYRSNMSPLRGEKLVFGPLSKNETSMTSPVQSYYHEGMSLSM